MSRGPALGLLHGWYRGDSSESRGSLRPSVTDPRRLTVSLSTEEVSGAHVKMTVAKTYTDTSLYTTSPDSSSQLDARIPYNSSPMLTARTAYVMVVDALPHGLR